MRLLKKKVMIAFKMTRCVISQHYVGIFLFFLCFLHSNISLFTLKAMWSNCNRPFEMETKIIWRRCDFKHEKLMLGWLLWILILNYAFPEIWCCWNRNTPIMYWNQIKYTFYLKGNPLAYLTHIVSLIFISEENRLYLFQILQRNV